MSAVGLQSVTLRPAAPADCAAVWRWRNDPETRRASFDSAVIPWEAHRAWFAESLARADRTLCVVVAAGVDSGVVRLDIRGADGEVSIHLAPGARGRGVGTAALRALADLAFSSLGLSRLMASIKPDNRASREAFRKAGFTLDEGGEVVTAVRTAR